MCIKMIRAISKLLRVKTFENVTFTVVGWARKLCLLAKKTFVNGGNTAKSAKVFTHESCRP